eukprot:2447462-Prymnesium_polylepis.1
MASRRLRGSGSDLALKARPEDRPSAVIACHDDSSKVPGWKVSLQAIVARARVPKPEPRSK